jgi:hypothetical protein
VPADWEHPKESVRDGRAGRIEERYTPLFPGEDYQPRADAWDEKCAKWKDGWRPDGCDSPTNRAMAYEQWARQRPHRDDYMPNWPEDQRTHYMMYEDTTEGTPISPAFATPEELARWLADTGASAMGGQTASYEAWLNVARGAWAPSMIYSAATGVISGVEASLAMGKADKGES